MYQEIARILEANAVALRQLAEMFESYQLLVEIDIGKYVTDFVATKPTLDMFSEEINMNLERAQRIRCLCADDVLAGMTRSCMCRLVALQDEGAEQGTPFVCQGSTALSVAP